MLKTLLCLLIIASPSSLLAEDLIEFLNGAKATGSMKEIRKEKKEFDFEVQLGGRKLVRTYTFDKVHAVTMQGKRHILTPLGEVPASDNTSSSSAVRTKAQVLDLINTVGPTPPDWFDAAPLDYPKTL